MTVARADISVTDSLSLPLEDNSVDLVFTSPPYEDARTYNIDYKMTGERWVSWAIPRFLECLRVCRGVVCWVVEGRTEAFRWSATPAMLMADLHRRGVHLRKPPAFHRKGIPGSGGPDWLRNDYEFIVCATNGGKLPWSENAAAGAPCKYPPGGAMSYRHADGRRRNAKTGSRLNRRESRDYVPPERANPGNVFTGAVGRGHMGHDLAHDNEAPFPEWLVYPFVVSFCPPGGTVLDPMCGSGTTLAVAIKHGRHAIGFDIRQSQVDLARRRVGEYAPLFSGEQG